MSRWLAYYIPAAGGAPIEYTVSVAGSVTATGALILQANLVFAGSVTPTGALINLAQKILSGSVTPTGVLTNVYNAFITVVGSVTPTGVLTNLFIEGGGAEAAITGVITSVGSYVRSVGRWITKW